MISRRIMSSLLLPFLLFLAMLWTCVAHAAATGVAGEEVVWRIRFLDAAVVQGPTVKLGEIAVPAGEIPKEQWELLAARELWPAPAESGKPQLMTRPRLQEAVVRTMKDLAPYCLFPPSTVIQRGGILIGKQSLQRLVENDLRPYLAALPGESGLSDFRLPANIFLANSGQNIELEAPRKVTPGRLSLRLLVKDVDGSVKNRLTGSVMVDSWVEAPCATSAMNRDDLLDLAKVTFKRVNLASLRGEVWDGKGGPWRVLRPLATDHIIYRSDLGHVPTVRKGDKLTLIYSGKTVRLTVPVEALADGTVGENISVRNLQSRKDVYGRVRDQATVIVDSPL